MAVDNVVRACLEDRDGWLRQLQELGHRDPAAAAEVVRLLGHLDDCGLLPSPRRRPPGASRGPPGPAQSGSDVTGSS